MFRKVNLLFVFLLLTLSYQVCVSANEDENIILQYDKKTQQLQIVNLPVYAVGLELTILLNQEPERTPVFTPFLSIDYGYLHQESPECFTLFVAGDHRLNESGSFFFGKLLLDGCEVIEVVKLKTVDFLLQEEIFSAVTLEVWEDLEAENSQDPVLPEEESTPELEDSDSDKEDKEENEDEPEFPPDTSDPSEPLTQEQRYDLLLQNYVDISPHWATSPILFALDRGYFSGTSSHEFSPDATMTRGMFVTVLGNLDDSDKFIYDISQFTDVSTADWFAPYVGWAVDLGVATGLDLGIFAPNTAITREQMAVMLCNYIKIFSLDLTKVQEPTKFSDHANLHDWSEEAVYQMQSFGLLSGKDGNLFDPQGHATRAEVATVLNNLVYSIENPIIPVG